MKIKKILINGIKKINYDIFFDVLGYVVSICSLIFFFKFITLVIDIIIQKFKKRKKNKFITLLIHIIKQKFKKRKKK